MKKQLFLLAVLCISISTSANTYTVTSTDDTGSGTLRQAVSDANANPGDDIIEFSTTINGDLIDLVSGQISITDNLSIYGNGISHTILQAPSDVFSIEPNVDTTIKDISFNIFFSTGINNISTPGSLGNLTVSDCSFISKTDNTEAGVQYDVPEGSVIVENCFFSGFRYGVGVIYSNTVTFKNNYSINCNNGLAIVYSNETFVTKNTTENCLFGYLLGIGSSGEVSNNTSYNNSHTGMYINNFKPGDLSVVLSNNTITGSQHGLIINEYSEANAHGLTVQNNILWNNSTSDFDLLSKSATGGNPMFINNIGKTSTSAYVDVAFISSADPKLDPLGAINNGGITPTVALLADSPAIDAGISTKAPLFDQRGFSRSGPIDIGAFEFGGATLKVDKNPNVVQYGAHPNPSRNSVFISGISHTANYKMYNALGTEIKKGLLPAHKKIDLRDIASGIYFLKFDNGASLKIIKE